MSFIGDLFGGSETTQGPTDVTPEEFKALRGPVADILRNLISGTLGFAGGSFPGVDGATAPTGTTAPGAPFVGRNLSFNQLSPEQQARITGDGTAPVSRTIFGPSGTQSTITGEMKTLAGTGADRFTAGLAPQETDLLTRLGSLTGAPSNALTQAQSFLTSQLQGQGLSPESNPFLAATIASAQRPLIEQFQDIQLPNLISQFTGAGQRVQPGGSSAFDRAGAIAIRGLTNSLADISTNLAGQNFQAERGRQQQAVTQASQLQTADIQSTIQGLQAVALPRLIEQFGIDRGLEEFNRRITTVLQAIQLAQGLPLQTIAQEGESVTRPNIIGTLGGIAFGRGGAFPGGI